MAYAGMSVVGGRGEGIVVATGAGTQVGRIASGLTTDERRRSPLQHELDRLVRLMLFVAVGLIVITVGLGFARGNPLADNLLAGITAAIAAVPEEPPVLLAVVLGLGAYRLLRRSVLVRRLNAEEVLGAIDVIVTDKTGTLTQNRLEVISVADAFGSDPNPAAHAAVLLDALRAEDDAWDDSHEIRTSSFTRALREAVLAAGGDTSLDPDDWSTRPRRPMIGRMRRPQRTGRARRNADPRGAGAMVGVSSGSSPYELVDWQARIETMTSDGQRVVALAGQVDGCAPRLRALTASAIRLGGCRRGDGHGTRASTSSS